MSPDSEDTKNGTYGVLSVATIISLGGFLDGFNLVALSAVLSFVSASFDITSAGIKGLLVGTVFLGGIPGAIILGSMSSRYGRREIFLYDILLFISESAGKSYLKVNPKYTSMKCSKCGNIKK